MKSKSDKIQVYCLPKGETEKEKLIKFMSL